MPEQSDVYAPLMSAIMRALRQIERPWSILAHLCIGWRGQLSHGCHQLCADRPRTPGWHSTIFGPRGPDCWQASALAQCTVRPAQCSAVLRRSEGLRRLYHPGRESGATAVGSTLGDLSQRRRRHCRRPLPRIIRACGRFQRRRGAWDVRRRQWRQAPRLHRGRRQRPMALCAGCVILPTCS
jgi:hypothetical protein